MRTAAWNFLTLLIGSLILAIPGPAAAADRPNIILIYADDLGYGDLSCYGAKSVSTPNVDALAENGLRFTDAHSASATCTPSRYALLTGEYPWRKKGTGILPGDAALIIEPGRQTLPSTLKQAGYRTGAVGKWHLGLGNPVADWNKDIRPGPLEIGFDSSYILAATGDRVPCVYLQDHHVVGLDPNDPITVSYKAPVCDDPLGRDHPELLKLHPSHGHDMTIVNGISRIGYMCGGHSARWVDEDIADVLTRQAVNFIETSRNQPFFLYFALHDVHVPRTPNARFAGKNSMGPRGDVILQLDWCVGEITRTLKTLGLSENTLVIFSSDNGPVVDDGYQDQAVQKLGTHRPAGPWRGSKYSAFEGGTRVPFIVSWPGRVKPGVSQALVCQLDLLASFAALTEQPTPAPTAGDSQNVLPALLGENTQGRTSLVEHQGRVLSIRNGAWKYIEPVQGKIPANPNVPRDWGFSLEPALYNLESDPQELTSLAQEQPEKLRQLQQELETIIDHRRNK